MNQLILIVVSNMLSILLGGWIYHRASNHLSPFPVSGKPDTKKPANGSIHVTRV